MTASTATDRYPSRSGGRSEIRDRGDPVVYGGPSDGPLRPEQLAAFAGDGFLQIETVFSAPEVTRLLAEGCRVALSSDPPGDGPADRGDGGGGACVFGVHRRPPFSDLVADPRLAAVARQLLGGGVYVHQSRLELDPGFLRGRGCYWHADFETWHVEDGMPAMRAVTASVALTPSREWNGPLMIIPGSHHRYVTCRGAGGADGAPPAGEEREAATPDDESLARLLAEAGDRIATFPASAGSVVFFDGNAMHARAPNVSPSAQATVAFAYNSVENTLRDPFAARGPRPASVASRDFSPV